MDNIFEVADERQVKALSLSVTDLSDWIREVIRANNLKAIVFIWDEFTEYFYNNARNLTGFQELCEISETDPFYFVLVTHVTQGLFHERDQDFIKLNGRFVSPHSLILSLIHIYILDYQCRYFAVFDFFNQFKPRGTLKTRTAVPVVHKKQGV